MRKKYNDENLLKQFNKKALEKQKAEICEKIEKFVNKMINDGDGYVLIYGRALLKLLKIIKE